MSTDTYVELNSRNGITGYTLSGSGIVFKLGFGSEEEWQTFRKYLVQAKGLVAINGDIYDHWKMLSWMIPDDRVHWVPLGSWWPDEITVEMKYRRSVESLTEEMRHMERIVDQL